MPDYKLPEKQFVKLGLNGQSADYTAAIYELHDGHVLVRVPNELAEKEPGDEVLLEFGLRKQYWQVQAKASAFFSVWWFLEEPPAANWKTKQRRRYVRILHEAPVVAVPQSLVPGQAAAPITLNFRDLSACGAYVLAEQPLTAQQLTVMLSLPELGTTAVAARVVREERLRDGQFAYGLDFDYPTPKIRDDLMQYVVSQIQKNLQQGHDITR